MLASRPMVDRAERRGDILRAARRVFATKGFHDTKVDDIVAAANVAKGTFYLYFRDKRSIFVELVDGLFQRISTAILRVDTDADVEAQVKHNLRAILAVLLDDRETTQILIVHATGLDPEFAEKIRSFYDVARTLLRESLAEGQRLGIVADGDPDVFATLSMGALKEVLFAIQDAEKAHVREVIVRDLFELLQHGFLRTAPKGRRKRRHAEVAAAPTPAVRAKTRGRS